MRNRCKALVVVKILFNFVLFLERFVAGAIGPFGARVGNRPLDLGRSEHDRLGERAREAAVVHEQRLPCSVSQVEREFEPRLSEGPFRRDYLRFSCEDRTPIVGTIDGGNVPLSDAGPDRAVPLFRTAEEVAREGKLAPSDDPIPVFFRRFLNHLNAVTRHDCLGNSDTLLRLCDRCAVLVNRRITKQRNPNTGARFSVAIGKVFVVVEGELPLPDSITSKDGYATKASRLLNGCIDHDVTVIADGVPLALRLPFRVEGAVGSERFPFCGGEFLFGAANHRVSIIEHGEQFVEPKGSLLRSSRLRTRRRSRRLGEGSYGVEEGCSNRKREDEAGEGANHTQPFFPSGGAVFTAGGKPLNSRQISKPRRTRSRSTQPFARVPCRR